MSPGRRLALAVTLIGVASAGCLATDVLDEAPTADASNAADASRAGVHGLPAASDDPSTVRMTLALEVTPRARGMLAVEAVELDPTPAPAETFDVAGPTNLGARPAVLATFEVPAGETLDPFELVLTLDDGLGPAELVFEVHAWTASAPATAIAVLDVAERGAVQVDRVEGHPAVEAVNDTATPLYGVLAWPDGPRRALTGFDHEVRVPEAYPRFGPGAEPTFEVDAEVEWRLNGERVGEGDTARLDPGPGKHELALEGPEEASTTLTFSINDRLHVEDRILVGTPEHREPVAGANADTHNVTIHEGASHLAARLVPIGEDSEVEDLDLYALNETGAVLAQSAGEGSKERLTVSRGDIRTTDVVQLRVHGDLAAGTEYKLTSTTFYRPW